MSDGETGVSLGRPWWLDRAETRAVMAALEAEGGPDCARFVGGCVRNAVMGLTPSQADLASDLEMEGDDRDPETVWPEGLDIDIATRLTPDRVVEALKAAGLKSVPTGLSHGTVTAIANRRPFEVTTLRRDVATDGRHAEVEFTDDWAEDAARRDFHMNALYADSEGRVFDPTGQGLADAKAGRVAFVGDARQRIREDYLRILRFFRFFAWYGRGEPDAVGLAACSALKAGIAGLSAERVQAELLKLLAAPQPRPAVNRMEKSGVLSQVLPEAAETKTFHRLAELSHDPVQLLSALLPDDGEVVRSAANRLRLSNAIKDRLVRTTADSPPARPSISLDMDEREARAVIYRLGWQTFHDRLMRAWAAEPWREEDADRLMALEDWEVPALPVGGKQIAAMGVEPGPRTGRILAAFEDQWVEADFPEDGHEARLKTVVEAGS
ncbi:CCA tRNA nucleotidyltransferase [Brevundimonas sp.]|uniref:CCA tRNA nucleotidyltransferase n=1 Tax=Brevundimonas sp. TaxID=1871086 RepID=UPI0035B0F9F8